MRYATEHEPINFDIDNPHSREERVVIRGHDGNPINVGAGDTVAVLARVVSVEGRVKVAVTSVDGCDTRSLAFEPRHDHLLPRHTRKPRKP